MRGSSFALVLITSVACSDSVQGPGGLDESPDDQQAPTDPNPQPHDPATPDPVVPDPVDPDPVDPPPTSSVITASLVATRLAGPAPLAVLFDATATTATGVALPFHQLHYAFNFGDDAAAEWEVTGLPKNTQAGAPLAAHVFDRPGTYTVRVRVSGVANEVEEVSVRVVVSDPATTYAGTNTVCVSTSSNFTGCPAGATQANALPSSYAGKRVLLRSGEQFGSVSLSGTDDNVLVATYGTGAKPRVQRINLGGSNSVAGWPDEVSFVDLDVINNFGINITASRVLVYRCEFTTPNTEKVDFGSALGYYVNNGSLPASAYYWPRELFLVDSTVIGDTNNDATPNVDVMGAFAKSALLGNTINRATEHSVRMWSINKSVIAHNAIGGEHYAANPPGIRAALKVHSAGVNPYADNVGESGLHISSSKSVTADNIFGTTSYQGSWLTGFAPQNADQGTVEGLEDIIQERDRFVRGPYTGQEIHNCVRRGTVRDALQLNGNAISMDLILPDEWSGDPGMRSWLGPYFGMADNY